MRPPPMKGSLIAVAALALMLPAEGARQRTGEELNLALLHLQRAVRTLPPVFTSPRLVQAADWLNSRSGRTDPENVSQEYVQSLRRAAELLTGAPSRALVEDVTAELEARVEHCRSLGIGMGGSVLVKVHTRRGPEDVRDLQVLYLLKIFEYVKGSSPINFPRLSTPTETRVDPGRYWVWARDPATGRISEPVLVRLAGRTEFDVDIPVP
jgi:hypothetical protein